MAGDSWDEIKFILNMYIYIIYTNLSGKIYMAYVNFQLEILISSKASTLGRRRKIRNSILVIREDL